MKNLLLCAVIAGFLPAVVGARPPLQLHFEDSRMDKLAMGMTVGEVEQIVGQKLWLKPNTSNGTAGGLVPVPGTPEAHPDYSALDFDKARKLFRLTSLATKSTTKEDALETMGKMGKAISVERGDARFAPTPPYMLSEQYFVCADKVTSVNIQIDRLSENRVPKIAWTILAHDPKTGVCRSFE